MSRRSLAVLSLLATSLALVLVITPWVGANPVTSPVGVTPATSDADDPGVPASLGALEFGPDGTLYAGDSDGASVWALAIDEKAPTAEETANIEDLDAKVASLLGTSVREVFFNDLALHPTSKTAFVSVTRGSGDEAQPALIRIDRSGELSVVDVSSLERQRASVPKPPSETEQLYRWTARSLTVTDLEVIGDTLYVAGLSNEEFASSLRRIKLPLNDEVESTGLEIYHGAHGAYESHAPIFAFTPYELDGEAHVLAGYLCTPLVVFPLDELSKEDRLRGKTIAELGFGNFPRDIVPYSWRGEDYVLINNSSRGVLKLAGKDILKAHRAEGITTEVSARAGVDYQGSPLGHVVQIAELDDETMLILGRSAENGALNLAARPKNWL